MNYRKFGNTQFNVSEISLGTWQLGSVWGMPFNEQVANETLKKALELNINCLDTADVYQGGLSEHSIGIFNKSLSSKFFVITKVGRKLPQQTVEGYSEENLRKFLDDSRENLKTETIDMVLLHCPPTKIYESSHVFDMMQKFKDEKKIKHFGVSIEKIEEGMMALEYEGVEAIEIIFNMFRLRPMEVFFQKAREKNVGIIVRVPLASGLLTGKYHEKTSFNPNDHRSFNRNGEAFDKGETFSGVDYHLGLKAVDELKALFNTEDLAPYALRWILMFDAVSTVIPGASTPDQIERNMKAIQLPPLTHKQMEGVQKIYDRYIKESVHHLW